MFIGPTLIYAMKHHTHTHTHSKMKQKTAYNKKDLTHGITELLDGLWQCQHPNPVKFTNFRLIIMAWYTTLINIWPLWCGICFVSQIKLQLLTAHASVKCYVYQFFRRQTHVTHEYLQLIPLLSNNCALLGKYWIGVLNDYIYICFGLQLKANVRFLK